MKAAPPTINSYIDMTSMVQINSRVLSPYKDHGFFCQSITFKTLPNHIHPPIPIYAVPGLRLVLLRDVIPAGIGRVILAVGRQASADAHATAVEFAHDPAANRR